MTDPLDSVNESYELTMEDFEAMLGWNDVAPGISDFFAKDESEIISILEQAVEDGDRAMIYPHDSNFDFMLPHYGNEGRSIDGGGAGASASYILEQIESHGGSLEETIRDLD